MLLKEDSLQRTEWADVNKWDDVLMIAALVYGSPELILFGLYLTLDL